MTAYFQSGGMADAILNLGLPAPIDVQVSGSNLDASYRTALDIANRAREIGGVSDVFIPQDLDYPALKVEIDRTSSGKLGLTQREIVQNVITALTSNQMVAPSYWVDQRTGNDYLLTVQYPEDQIRTLRRPDGDSAALRRPAASHPPGCGEPDDADRIAHRSGPLPAPAGRRRLRRAVRRGPGQGGRRPSTASSRTPGSPTGVRVDLRGMVQGMRSSFSSFGFGLLLAVALLYLILVAQFRSFLDPFLILSGAADGHRAACW